MFKKKCDVYQGGIFNKMGYSLVQRKQLFYLICIMFRLMLAGIVFNFSDNKKLQYALVLLSLAGIYSNYSKLGECVWWSRQFHLIIAVLLFIVTGLTILGKIKDSKWMSYLLYIDVIFGLFYSFGKL